MKGLRPAYLVVALVGITLACGGESGGPAVAIPTAATPAPAPSFPTVTVSGSVFERVSGGPASGASVVVAPARRSPPWPQWLYSARVEADGRYQLKVPEDPELDYVKAWKMGYVQQCAVAVTLQADLTMDLTITPFADVVSTGVTTQQKLLH